MSLTKVKLAMGLQDALKYEVESQFFRDLRHFFIFGFLSCGGMGVYAKQTELDKANRFTCHIASHNKYKKYSTIVLAIEIFRSGGRGHIYTPNKLNWLSQTVNLDFSY